MSSSTSRGVAGEPSTDSPANPAAAARAGKVRRDQPHSAENATAPATAVGRSRLARLTGVQILATGSYAPPLIVRNEDLAEHGFDADWIVQRTGIRERRRAADDMATSDLAFEAAKNCLERAGVAASEVDLIIVGTMTPDSPMPSTACQLQRKLACSAPAFDVNAACAGFAFAMITGMQYVASGFARRVLVVGADVMMRVMDPADHKTFPLFGDGAGAVLLGPGTAEQGMLSYVLGADGTGADLLKIPGGGSREPLTPEALACGKQYMQMDGRAVFKWAIRLLGDSVRELLAAAEIEASDLSLAVLHQANYRILEAAREDLGLPSEKLVVNLDRYGNTSAGSIPLALDEMHRAGRIKPGDHLLLCGFGAGLAWGGGIFRW
jgi:3-oxoacyl-[acyl-carrier-protein] synthase-3